MKKSFKFFKMSPRIFSLAFGGDQAWKKSGAKLVFSCFGLSIFKKTSFKNEASPPVPVCRQGREGRGFLWFGEEGACFFGERLLSCFIPAKKLVEYSQGRNKALRKERNFWPVKALVFVLSFFIFGQKFLASSVFAQSIAGSSAIFLSEERSFLDFRARQLEKFLQSFDSPLASSASFFVQMADKYQVDWRLVPAIAGVESTFGKRVPPQSFNPFGWNNGLAKFSSWEEAIEVVTSTLGEKYYSRGLKTPAKIAPVYCPPSKTWAGKVQFFMKKIDDFEKEVFFESTPLFI